MIEELWVELDFFRQLFELAGFYGFFPRMVGREYSLSEVESLSEDAAYGVHGAKMPKGDVASLARALRAAVADRPGLDCHLVAQTNWQGLAMTGWEEMYLDDDEERDDENCEPESRGNLLHLIQWIERGQFVIHYPLPGQPLRQPPQPADNVRILQLAWAWSRSPRAGSGKHAFAGPSAKASEGNRRTPHNHGRGLVRAFGLRCAHPR